MSNGKSKVDNAVVLNTEAIAKMFNMTSRRVRQLVEEGVIERVGHGRFNLVDTVSKYVNFIKLSADAYINAKDWANTTRVMQLYNKSGGKVLQGLVVRRKEEAELFLKSSTVNKKEVLKLNETGRKEIRELLKKARKAKIIDAAFHTDEKINAYTDTELLSYQAAVVNRTFK